MIIDDFLKLYQTAYRLSMKSGRKGRRALAGSILDILLDTAREKSYNTDRCVGVRTRRAKGERGTGMTNGQGSKKQIIFLGVLIGVIVLVVAGYLVQNRPARKKIASRAARVPADRVRWQTRHVVRFSARL
jgi:hypothetical protein